MRAMIRSMSGHGRGEAASDRHRVVVEIRAVNHRFCRISVRVPAELASFEERARRTVQERVQRGKVDLTLSVEGAAGAAGGVDVTAARVWGERLRAVADDLDLEPPTLADLLALPGVLVEGAQALDPERDGALLDRATAAALEAFDDIRGREGEHLAADLRNRVEAIRTGVEKIETVASELPNRTRDGLRDRIAELLAEVGTEVDEDRIVQEAAHSAERSDITEELVRLRSHLDKIDGLLDSDEAVGRTLEFLAQELHRELNTIGAKTKELEVTDVVVALKAELEKIREQVQNVE